MGEWKAPLSLRVRQDLRREMEDFALTERRKLGNVGEVLVEWAWEQLKSVGSINRLLKFRVRVPIQRCVNKPRGNHAE